MQSIAELPEFIRRAEKLFLQTERQALITHLAKFPQAGDLVPGTGGIRKLRWAREGAGKRGGARVIYFFHNETMPLYLLTVFAKGEKANLSKAERNELAKLVQLLLQLSEHRK